MTHYIAVVHKDEGCAYGASFPDVPGCFSAADEETDLLPNAMEALEFYTEDETLPAPSSIEVIRSKNDARQDMPKVPICWPCHSSATPENPRV